MKRLFWLILFSVLLGACNSNPFETETTTKKKEEVSEISPTVVIKFPYDKMLVGGLINLEISIRDDGPVIMTKFVLDEKVIRQESSRVENLDLNFDSVNIPGFHVLGIEAYDEAGNIGQEEIEVEIEPNKLRQKAVSFIKEQIGSRQIDGSYLIEWWKPEQLPIKVKVSPLLLEEINLKDIEEAVNFWEKYTGINFFDVEIADKDMTSFDPEGGEAVYIQYRIPWYEGSQTLGFAWRVYDYNNGKLEKFVIEFRSGYVTTKAIAHELGHTLFLWHVSDGTIMNPDSKKNHMWMDSVTVKALQMLYKEEEFQTAKVITE